jgi:cathepsin K
VTLAPQDMVSCDYENYACGGGYLLSAVDYLESEGVATETCMPYQDKETSCTFTCQNDT